jgi:hypothetical protein
MYPVKHKEVMSRFDVAAGKPLGNFCLKPSSASDEFSPRPEVPTHVRLRPSVPAVK